MRIYYSRLQCIFMSLWPSIRIRYWVQTQQPAHRWQPQLWFKIFPGSHKIESAGVIPFKPPSNTDWHIATSASAFKLQAPPAPSATSLWPIGTNLPRWAILSNPYVGKLDKPTSIRTIRTCVTAYLVSTRYWSVRQNGAAAAGSWVHHTNK
jgi:hypothetical protein